MNMLHKRTSSVNEVNLTSLSITSIFEIGDSHHIQAFSRAIALQREAQIFYSNEIDFGDYDIFSDPIPFEPITEQLTYEHVSLNPIIKVNKIKVNGVSTSSLLHIGNTRNAMLESRVKHIRHLKSEH